MGPGTPGRRLGRQPTSSCRSSIAFCHPIGCSKQWTGRFMRYHYHPLPNINAVFSMRFASHRLLCGMYWMFHVSSVTCVLRSFGAFCIPRFRRLRLLHSTSSANSPPSRHRSASHHMSSQLTTWHRRPVHTKKFGLDIALVGVLRAFLRWVVLVCRFFPLKLPPPVCPGTTAYLQKLQHQVNMSYSYICGYPLQRSQHESSLLGFQGEDCIALAKDIMWLEDPRPRLGALPASDFYGSPAWNSANACLYDMKNIEKRVQSTTVVCSLRFLWHLSRRDWWNFAWPSIWPSYSGCVDLGGCKWHWVMFERAMRKTFIFLGYIIHRGYYPMIRGF